MGKPIESTRTGFEIAVIGMAGRFPGAAHIDEFWENIKNGKESITLLSREQAGEAGISREMLDNPDYVRTRGGVLSKKEYFDAAFFGYTPAEAELMDPQLRILHQCTWQALEHAGYVPGNYNGIIGIYAGASENFNWQGLGVLSGKWDLAGAFAAANLVQRDFFCTRVSYRLNLKGPAVQVQSACSTSLVAIHLACRALITAECDIALAGGVKIMPQENRSYLYREGMVSSPDGHCRAFDKDARGTAEGDGIGIVVLKRLKHALADRDTLHAIIKGSAVNNDGIRKVGYTAPSIEGQAEAIKKALRMGQVDPETITYIEAHGTGTILGDPIEIEALARAFNTDKKKYCAIGSVKTNIGHLDTAAGAAGFIKTVLALKNGLVPPSINFTSANPAIDFENSPFYVNTSLRPWERAGFPLRAGVSSFGIGGTNAHVVLEEAPKPDEPGDLPGKQGGPHLLLLSARTETALEKISDNLAGYFKKNPGIHLADAAYTLEVGREAFQYRKMLKCTGVDQAVEQLSSSTSVDILAHFSREEPKVVFMFPGQGSQYVDMGRGLYETEPVFREETDRCFDMLASITGNDLREILYPGAGEDPGVSAHREITFTQPQAGINQTDVAQPLLLIIEYALARLLMHWGIAPYAMIGHSIGEYTAACLSGVLSLESALNMAVTRGKMMRQMPGGAMVSVPLPAHELIPLPDEQLDLAAINGPALCVVSGANPAIQGFVARMQERGIQTRQLHTSHAFHSRSMEPMLEKFKTAVAQVSFNQPGIPYISNLTGDWITVEQARDPGYWASHLRQTVRFSDGLARVLADHDHILLVEVGPGQTLTGFARQHPYKKNSHHVINSIRHPRETAADAHYLRERIGKLWLFGKSVNWNRVYENQARRRIPLPTYPFEEQPYWIHLDQSQAGAAIYSKSVPIKGKPAPGKRFYIPSWKRSVVSYIHNISPGDDREKTAARWLVFCSSEDNPQQAFMVRLMTHLESQGHSLIRVNEGSEFARCGDELFTVHPAQPADYDRLITGLHQGEGMPQRILHAWNLSGGETGEPGYETSDHLLDRGFYSLIYLARALGKQAMKDDIELVVLSTGLHEVTGEESVCPIKAALLGPVQIIPTEYPRIRCRSIDVEIPEPGNKTKKETALIQHLAAELELNENNNDTIVAWRGNHRLVRTFEPVELENPPGPIRHLRENGVYLVTGGLGGIGGVFARYLARQVKAKLILIGRTPLPHPDQRDQWLSTHPSKDPISRKIRLLRELESLAAGVAFYPADAADYQQVHQVITAAEKQFGPINGVFHCAGIPGAGIIQRKTREAAGQVLAPKIKGTLVLDRVLENRNLDFFILCSSINSIVPAPGQVDYCAANAFLDAFALWKSSRDNLRVISINWDTWLEIGMAVEAARQGEPLKDGLTPGEGIDALERIFNCHTARVVAAARDLLSRLEKKQVADAFPFIEKSHINDVRPEPGHSRPELSTLYTAPTNNTEQKITAAWQEFLGIHPIGIMDDFFELGGDSLKAITLLGRLHKELSIDIPLSEFFNAPTTRELALLIENISNSSPAQQFQSIMPSEQKDYYPLSSAQRRLYILQQMEPASVAYNIPDVMAWQGKLDIKRLEKVFRQMIRRNSIFRTCFSIREGQPVQEVHKQVDFRIEFHEAAEENQNRRQELEEIIKNFSRPFDLAHAPLLRAGLLHIDTEGEDFRSHYILMLDFHHIIYDGTSMGIFFRQLTALYKGDTLEPLKFQYCDYCQWQQDRLQKEKEKEILKKQENFWLKEFREPVPLLNLPVDFPRPAVQCHDGGMVRFILDSEETSALITCARAHDVTLFMIILAIYNVLLFKLSAQEDIVVGTPVSGRKHPDLQHLIGIFLNTLALRNFIPAQQSFSFFLNHLKEKTLGAFDNQDYPFEDLVDRAAAHRDLSRNPLFDVMFIFHNQFPPGREGQEAGQGIKKEEEAELEHLGYERQTSEFDLTLMGYQQGNRLIFECEYSSVLFKRESIERLINYFKRIAVAAVQNPGQTIQEIRILSGEEQKQLLYDFNNTRSRYPENTAVHELFAVQAKKTPHHTAIISGDRQVTYVTYHELEKQATGLAQELAAHGLGPGCIAGLLPGRNDNMIKGIIGILKTGAAYLPMDPRHPGQRIAYMLADSKASILVTDRQALSEAEIAKTRAGKTIYLDENSPISHSSPASPASAYSAYFPSIGSLHQQPAYVIYTSGSTGYPKGVMIRHDNLVNFITAMALKIPFEAAKTILALTTISFDIFVLETLAPLTRGMKVIIADENQQKDPEQAAALIKKHCVDMLQLTPSRLQLFISWLEHMDFLKGISHLMVGGEVFPQSLYEKIKSRYAGKIYNLYGPTETTVWSTLKDLTGEEIINVNIGSPVANTYIYLLDRYLRLQPVGVCGEIWIGGMGVGLGYMNQPELTAEKFMNSKQNFPESSYNSTIPPTPSITGHKIYRTGDLGRWLSNGDIECLGRLDHQVKIRGFRIEPGEIENQLLLHQRIREAAVVVLEDPVPVPVPVQHPSQAGASETGNKNLCAYVCGEDMPVVEELREHLSGKLPDYMIPSYFVTLEKFPLTPNGKIDRKALPAPEIKPGNNFTEPRDEMEAQLAEIWAEVLQVPIGIDNSFFELGGHSLKAIQVVAKLEKAGISFPFNWMFMHPTIRKQAQLIRETSPAVKSLIQAPREAEKDFKERFGAEMHLVKYILPTIEYYVIYLEDSMAGGEPLESLLEYIRENWQETLHPHYIKKLSEHPPLNTHEKQVSEEEFYRLLES